MPLWGILFWGCTFGGVYIPCIYSHARCSYRWQFRSLLLCPLPFELYHFPLFGDSVWVDWTFADLFTVLFLWPPRLQWDCCRSKDRSWSQPGSVWLPGIFAWPRQTSPSWPLVKSWSPLAMGWWGRQYSVSTCRWKWRATRATFSAPQGPASFSRVWPTTTTGITRTWVSSSSSSIP